MISNAAVARAHKLRALGWSYSQIAADAGVCENTASNWCRRDGKPKPAAFRHNPEMVSQICALNQIGMSRVEIASKLGVSVDTVRYVGIREGIYRRGGGHEGGTDARENTSVLPFQAISPPGRWTWCDRGLR